MTRHISTVLARATTYIRGVALAALMLPYVSCAKPAKAPEDPGYADMAFDESRAAGSDSRLPESRFSALAAGDRFVWRGSMFGIEIGRLAMAVGYPGSVDGRDAVIVTSQFESTAAAAIFAPVKSVLTTAVDTATVQPIYHRREVEKGTDFAWTEVRFTAGEFPVKFRRRSDDTDSDELQLRVAGVPLYDINSLLLAARTWNMAEGERAVIHVFRETYTWSMQIERAQGTETRSTRLGEFPAIRYDVVGRALERDGSIDEDESPRQYSFWITDDAKRLPIAVIARTDYGDLRMELVQYDKLAAP